MADRILLLGMNGALTGACLHGLLSGGVRPVALLLPAGSQSQSPMQRLPPDMTGDLNLTVHSVHTAPQQQAWAAGIPVWECGRPDRPDAFAWLQQMAPDLILVACYPWRLPASWLDVPGQGAFNVHPSLLPAFRGPEPLFWQFRAGVAATGVTVHAMTAALDEGAIVAQASWPLPAGWAEATANNKAGAVAAELIVDLLSRPVAQWPRRAQGGADSSYQGRPTEADREILPQWSAVHACNFLHGTTAWGPWWLRLGEHVVWVSGVVDWDPAGTLAAPYQQIGRTVRVAFQPGTVDFAIASEKH
jgi:methionyl-tRNA formyltransferase